MILVTFLRRGRRPVWLLLLLFAVFPSGFSQILPAASSGAMSVERPADTEIRLGNAAVALAGPWKFEPGDSPQVNGAFAWAQPDFDDSKWAEMDLHSKTSRLDPGYGSGGYVTGWTVRGFPDLTGFAWYRLRIHVANSPERLWIKMPNHVDDSYQVFANGQYVGEFGGFTVKGIECYRSRPLIFELPAPDAHGDIVLAMRFYMQSWVIVGGTSGDSGGMHQAPVVGIRPQIELLLDQAQVSRVLNQIVSAFVVLLMLVSAAGAARIYLLDREQTTYLWLTLTFVLSAVVLIAPVAALFTYMYTQSTQLVLVEGGGALALMCWVFFWRRWFGLERSRWVMPLILICVAIVIVSSMLLYLNLSSGAHLLSDEIRTGANLLLVAMLFVTVAQSARRDRAGALTALIPVALLTVGVFAPELMDWFHIRTSFFPFGVTVTESQIALLLMMLVVGVLAARRVLTTQVEQRLHRQTVERELEQARELQQHVLVPEPLRSPGFEVETVYRPAQTVGGDFFQTLTKPDGTLLVVIGDVSGKGVSAAMLVAVLVGAIRNQAEYSVDPARMLEMLNRRLLGRSGGHFATCLAAEFRGDGTLRIANAGHLPPYLNGQEMELEGSLPLGMVAEGEASVRTFEMKPGDRLTFMTDGVVEATSATKELFGFERTRAVSQEKAAEIADRAQEFGQEDDITVVVVEIGAVAQY